MKVEFFHLHVVRPCNGNPSSDYDDRARRFTESILTYPANHHINIVVCNGTPDEAKHLFVGLDCSFSTYYGRGWDIGTYIHCANAVDCDFIVLSNTQNYFVKAGWFQRFMEARDTIGEGLFGTSAAIQRTPHIRTGFFGCHPELLRSYPLLVHDRASSYEFESGMGSLTRHAGGQGIKTIMVTWDGFYGPEDWHVPANTFRKGDQSNLLIRDRHTLIYDRSKKGQRYKLMKESWT